jgi:hypothetical protein
MAELRAQSRVDGPAEALAQAASPIEETLSGGPMSNILHPSLETLFRELIDGPAPQASWMLNPGDAGLLRSLEMLTAPAASGVPAAGGASIAAHVDHVRYGLSLMNRWGRGEPNPWATADWTASWRRSVVTEEEWAALRQSLATEARAWLDTLRTPRQYSPFELNGVIASIAHLAYHVGAIRQIDRSMRGPAAE